MKRVALILLTAFAFSYAMHAVLYEDSLEAVATLEQNEILVLNEIEFSVQNSAIVSINFTGYIPGPHAGYVDPYLWMELDGNLVSTSIRGSFETSTADSVPFFIPKHGTYMKELEPGTHTVQVKVWGRPISDDQGTVPIQTMLLQVLVLEAITPPPQEAGKPWEETRLPESPPSSSSVTVPDCIEVTDDAGRQADCRIENDQLMISSLRTGTYFATSKQGKTIKIVKIE
jgi:hypothetical protein